MATNITVSGVITEIRHKYIDGLGRVFHNATLDTERLSGTVDRLRLVIPDVEWNSYKIGDFVSARGRIESRNTVSHGKNRLLLEVVVSDCSLVAVPLHDNRVCIDKAYVVKEPTYRCTPLGREICDVMVAVNYEDKSCYIPVIGWGSMARQLSGMHTGDCIEHLNGRFQSREYQKVLTDKDGDEFLITRIAYELSITSIGREQ